MGRISLHEATTVYKLHLAAINITLVISEYILTISKKLQRLRSIVQYAFLIFYIKSYRRTFFVRTIEHSIDTSSLHVGLTARKMTLSEYDAFSAFSARAIRHIVYDVDAGDVQ